MTTGLHARNFLTQTEWFELIGRMVSEIGTPGFMLSWVEAVRSLTRFDYTVTFAYNGSNVPVCLHHTFPERQFAIHVTDYQIGPFFLDPLYKASIDGKQSGVFRLGELAPDQFYKSEYYRSYYVQTGPVDEVAFFVSGNASWSVVTSLMRRHSDNVFSAHEMKLLRNVEPMLRALAFAHWQSDPRLDISKPPLDEKEILRQTIQSALQRLEIKALTAREMDVVGLVLQGHSSESIANILHISSGTVRIHRKNVYAKMRISSQRELFSMFMQAPTQTIGKSTTD